MAFTQVLSLAQACGIRSRWSADTLEYRADYLFRTVLGLVPVFGDVLVQMAVFRARPGTSLRLRDLPHLLSCIVAAQMVLQLTGGRGIDERMAQDIRDGTLWSYLLRPMGNLEYRLATTAGREIVTLPAVVLPSLVVFVAFGAVSGYSHEVWRLRGFGVSLLMAAVLKFVLDYLIGLTCFWLLEISALFFVKDWIAAFLAGGLVPVDLFPGWLCHVARALPFPYTADSPVRVLLRIAAPDEVIAGLLFQTAWACIIEVAARLT